MDTRPTSFQACEDGSRLEELDLTRLAAFTADTVIHNIHGRLVQRPAGTGICLLLHILQVEGLSAYSVYFCFSKLLGFFHRPLKKHFVHVLVLIMESQSMCNLLYLT